MSPANVENVGKVAPKLGEMLEIDHKRVCDALVKSYIKIGESNINKAYHIYSDKSCIFICGYIDIQKGDESDPEIWKGKALEVAKRFGYS